MSILSPRRARPAVAVALDRAAVVDVANRAVGKDDAELVLVAAAAIEKSGGFRLDPRTVVGMDERNEAFFRGGRVGQAVKPAQRIGPHHAVLRDVPDIGPAARERIRVQGRDFFDRVLHSFPRWHREKSIRRTI